MTLKEIDQLLLEKRKELEDKKEQLKAASALLDANKINKYICPITLEIARDPYVGPDQVIYEKSAFQEYMDIVKRDNPRATTFKSTTKSIQFAIPDSLVTAVFVKEDIEALFPVMPFIIALDQEIAALEKKRAQLLCEQDARETSQTKTFTLPPLVERGMFSATATHLAINNPSILPSSLTPQSPSTRIGSLSPAQRQDAIQTAANFRQRHIEPGSYKVVVVGAPGESTGKSKIISRYCNNIGLAPFFVGSSFAVKNITVHNTSVKLQIWDTAGQERFLSLTTAYYHNAAIILIIYNFTDPASCEYAHKMLVDPTINGLLSRQQAYISLVAHGLGTEGTVIPHQQHNALIRLAGNTGIGCYTLENEEGIDAMFQFFAENAFMNLENTLEQQQVLTPVEEGNIESMRHRCCIM